MCKFCKRIFVQSFTINLNELQASYLLPLLDDLRISYTLNEKQDFIADIEQDAKDYMQGKLKCKNLAQYKKQMQDFMNELKEKYAD